MTGAGPGESNHNFGMAVDIGFKNFKWMRGNGAPTVDDWWLNNMPGVKSLPLWKVRNAVAKQFKLFPTALKGDVCTRASPSCCGSTAGLRVGSWKPNRRSDDDGVLESKTGCS